MNIIMLAHCATVALVVAKLIGVAEELSWWTVFTPSMVALVLALLYGIAVVVIKEMEEHE